MMILHLNQHAVVNRPEITRHDDRRELSSGSRQQMLCHLQTASSGWLPVTRRHPGPFHAGATTVISVGGPSPV